MSRNRYVLAVDIGTTRTKGIILDKKANMITTTSLTHSDVAAFPGWHEHDAESTWWGEFVAAVHHLLSAGTVLASGIDCVCITGMFACFCPTDEYGVPLCNALLYDDSRAVEFARQLRNPQNAILKGNELLARLIWFRSTFPDMQPRLQRVFSTHSFIVYRLTGRYCIDSHTACAFGSIFEPENFSWRRNELIQAQIEEVLLPEVLPPQAVAGHITSVSARETGLSSGTPVLVGTGDMFASLLGSGVHRPGDAMVQYGTGGALVQLTQDIDYLLGAQGYTGGDQGMQWLVALPRSGKQLEWFSNLVGDQRSTINPYDVLQYLDAAIDVSKPARSQILFLNDTGLPQEFVTVSAPLATFLAVPLDVTPSDLYRAMLEGFGYRIRQGAESIGPGDSQIRWYGVGGGTQSAKWCQIVTDIVGQEQTVCTYGDTAFGGALIAGHAAALFDLQVVIEQRIEHANIYHPQTHLRHFYDNQYRNYLHASQLLQSYRKHCLGSI